MEPKGNKAEALLQRDAGAVTAATVVPPPPPTTEAATTTTTATAAAGNGQASPQWQSLPPGWSTAVSPQDGRVYYYEQASGQTSWTHPLSDGDGNCGSGTSSGTSSSTVAPLTPPPPPTTTTFGATRSGILNSSTPTVQSNDGLVKNPTNTSSRRNNLILDETRRPESHSCLAIVGIILFIPLGVLSMIYSLKVEEAWEQGRPYDSARYSRRAALFGQLACALGAVFWIYWLFFSGPGGPFDFHWPAEWVAE